MTREQWLEAEAWEESTQYDECQECGSDDMFDDELCWGCFFSSIED